MKPRKEAQELFADELHSLRLKRRAAKSGKGATKPRRKVPSQRLRDEIFESTGGRCHICGGLIHGSWAVDHIQPHSSGGSHARINFLPAHPGCNNYRWDFTPEEYQVILKLGVWTRTLIERKTKFGLEVASRFLAYDQKRAGRRTATPR